MNPLTALKALRELGPTAVTLNALYKLGLKTGFFRLQERRNPHLFSFGFLFDLPTRDQLLAVLGPAGLEQLTAEADEVVARKYRPFGSEPVEINLTPPSQRHWTECETPHHTADIKLIWEPARFGWAFTLGRAFHATGDEKYAAAFWRYFESFQAANPPYFGENWMNGQEVGLRLIALTWAGQVFCQAEQTTPARLAALAVSIGIHAARIPATLLYARSQNNNHLLTEAAALYTASFALPEHPQAAEWRKTGQKWLHWCFEHQIDENGEYVQHSTNYHRLMLQTALWVFALDSRLLKPENGEIFDSATHENMARATRWLLYLLDPISGRVPNLGPNDGAYIFPLSTCPFSDFRPVARAAARAFLRYTLQRSPQDELSLWLGLPTPTDEGGLNLLETLPEMRRLVYMRNAPPISVTASPSGQSWAYLRTANFRSRPGHADLLHFDLWWRGFNITLDPGTYHYNAPPPWDNALTHARFHNNITIDDADLFTRAGRFLYLDWRKVRCKWIASASSRWNAWQGLTANHTAYGERFGIGHQRNVEVNRREQWKVTDTLTFVYREQRSIRLHWLLPDWEWQVENGDSIFEIRLKSPQGWITLKVGCGDEQRPAFTLVRAGEVLWGNLADCPPTRGWFSPTYGVKEPALSLTLEVVSDHSLQFITLFELPAEDESHRLNALAQSLEQFAAQLQSAAARDDLPIDPADLLPTLTETAQKLREGDIQALETYRRLRLEPSEWRESLGDDAAALLEEIEAEMINFRLY